MRESYNKQLEHLHSELILMGAMCEEAINNAIKGIIENDSQLREDTITLERDIKMKQREIEQFCVRLLLREQPIASDLRFIIAAQKMINDMYRIGNQDADIALDFEEIGKEQRFFVVEHVEKMAQSVSKMLVDAVDSFVNKDIEKAKSVILFDDVVDNYFIDVKKGLIEQISKDYNNGVVYLDILMIAKHLERIGDHTRSIAKMVVFSI
jgi:phosphate transport system protein